MPIFKTSKLNCPLLPLIWSSETSIFCLPIELLLVNNVNSYKDYSMYWLIWIVADHIKHSSCNFSVSVLLFVSVVLYVAFVLSFLIPYLILFWCLGKTVCRGILWISYMLQRVVPMTKHPSEITDHYHAIQTDESNLIFTFL